MKLKLNIWLTALLGLLLTACSEEERDRSLAVEERAVEIQLGLGDASMRAAIESDANSNFVIDGSDGNYLGVFCLAYDKRSSDVPAIDWTASAMTAPMSNVQTTSYKDYSGKYSDDGQGGRVFEVVSKLKWTGTYLYPMGGWYKYGFYGYYPRVDDAQVTLSSNTLTADLTLTGYDDVVCGNSHSMESGDAFCAAYFLTNSGTTPLLTLNHALARLRFRAIAKNDYTGSTQATQIRVAGVTVHQMPTDYRLTIADKENTANEGTLTRIGTGTADVALRDMYSDTGLGANYILRNTHTSSNPLVIGDEVMIPTDESAYYISVTLQNGRGEDCSPQGYWRVQAPAGGFQPGVTYWVEMKISSNPSAAEGELTINE